VSPLTITSSANPRVRALARLSSRRERRATNRFLIEGRRELETAVRAGVVVETVLLLDGRPGLDIGDSVETVLLGPRAFAAVSRRQNPDGIAGVGVAPAHDLGGLEPGGEALVLVVEGIEKPGNLGAMFRTADAAGVDALIAADPVADFENPNVIRASQGSVFAVPAAAASTEDVIAYLTDRSIRIAALSPHAQTRLWDVDLSAPVALVVGSEATGLSDEMAAAADTFEIPMHGAADSLNASVAAAIALYEVVRRRSGSGF
jgi:TrmH family RNA methyltransferase